MSARLSRYLRRLTRLSVYPPKMSQFGVGDNNAPRTRRGVSIPLLQFSVGGNLHQAIERALRAGR